MQTISGDILTWSWFSQPHGYDFNGFLISDRSGNLGIDPVEPSAQVLHELTQKGVSRILSCGFLRADKIKAVVPVDEW